MFNHELCTCLTEDVKCLAVLYCKGNETGIDTRRPKEKKQAILRYNYLISFNVITSPYIFLYVPDAERKSLYTLFLESVQSRLRHGEEPTAQVLTEQQETKGNLIKIQSIAERHLELDDVHDPLLAINFAR